ncbi:MAG: GGDEF domain-containing protein [Parvibaculaceae bacterium]|nr:GGDEF domain-containing protein [Parvibaculaceae bacterium]
MDSGFTLGLDPRAMFLVNAISLIVFSGAFFSAWIKEKKNTYWLYWIAANMAFGLSFVLFAVIDLNSVRQFVVPNCLLVLGLGFRWQALQVFYGRDMSFRASFKVSYFPVLLVAVLFLFKNSAGTGVVYGGVNVVIAVQLMLIIHVLLTEKREDLPSRWGLVVAYALIWGSTVARVIQGWWPGDDVTSLLPRDLLLEIHLLLATVHIIASGAFALSLAYERGASDLRQLALRDPLTGLHNRRAFEEFIARATPLYLGERFAVATFDIDHFKRINDQFGHALGDAALQRFALVLLKILRQTDFVSRMGGEEFVVVLPKTSLAEAHMIVERVRSAVEKDGVRHREAIVRFTVSAGVHGARTGTMEMSEIVKRADANLYAAKIGGRNRVEVSSS